MSEPRTITINEAVDTQDYSHEEMENLVFIEKSAYDDLKVKADKQAEVIEELTDALVKIKRLIRQSKS